MNSLLDNLTLRNRSIFPLSINFCSFQSQNYRCSLADHWLLLTRLWTELEVGRESDDYNLHAIWCVARGMLKLKENTNTLGTPLLSVEELCPPS